MSKGKLESNHAGEKLLQYLLKHPGVDINQLNLKDAPPELLRQYPGATSAASLAVHMLLEDDIGNYTQYFVKHCKPYKRGQKCQDIPRLKRTFQTFVQNVLFRHGRDVSKTPLPPRERESVHEVTDREKMYQRLHDIVDFWGEKSAKLMEVAEDFLRKLENTYRDPRPESWGEYDSIEDGYDGYITTASKHEEIPNRYLDMLGKVLCIFHEQIKILDSRINKKNPKSSENEPVLEDLNSILYMTRRMKNLPWKNLRNYYYTEVSLLRQMEEIVHRINTIQYRLK